MAEEEEDDDFAQLFADFNIDDPKSIDAPKTSTLKTRTFELLNF